MPENTYFYQISLGEGFLIQFKSMQIGVVRKTVCIHRYLFYLKNTFHFFLSRKAKASGFTIPFRQNFATDASQIATAGVIWRCCHRPAAWLES